MNEKNFEYLKNSLKYLGFGEKLNDVLESALKRNLPKFSIGMSNSFYPPGIALNDHSKADYIQYQLNFSAGKDMHFLNDYSAKLLAYGAPDSRAQTFNLENTWITAKEAYNLLSGRAVLKMQAPKEQGGEKIPVWKQLDLQVTGAGGNYPTRNFYPQYGFDLEKVINTYPLEVLAHPELRADLKASLEKGNFSGSTMEIEGIQRLVYLSANPEAKILNVYDSNLVPIRAQDIWPERVEHQNTAVSNGMTEADMVEFSMVSGEPYQKPQAEQEQTASSSKASSTSKVEPGMTIAEAEKPWQQSQGEAESESRSVGR